MNFKIDKLKFVKIRELLGTFKIHKIRIHNLCPQSILKFSFQILPTIFELLCTRTHAHRHRQTVRHRER